MRLKGLVSQRWANCDSVAVEELREHYKRPWFIPVESEVGRRDWFFMGTPGFGAPFHLDEVKYPSWQAQVYYRTNQSTKYLNQTENLSVYV